MLSFSLHDKVYSSEADDDGFFLCPCPTHQASSVKFTLDTLTKHIDKWKDVYEPCFGPHQERLEEISSELMATATMRSLELCINTRANILICTACAVAVQPQYAASHLAAKHKHKRTDLATVLAPLTLSDTFPDLGPGPVEALHGLPVSKAFQCTHCRRILGSEKHLKSECTNKHGPFAIESVDAQNYNNHNARSYFAVKPAGQVLPAIITFEDHVAKVREEIDRGQQSVQCAPDARNLPDWLKRTRWHEHVAGYTPKDIRSLVSFPSLGEFPTLKRYVSTLLHECCALIPTSRVLLLQRLNSADIAKDGVNNRPFAKHQEYDTTMASYAAPIITLVAMLLRRTEKYPIELPTDVEAEVARVRVALEETEAAGTNAIYQLLLSLWTREWHPTSSRHVVDPMIHFLVLSCLRDDGGFLEPTLFTNVIARLEYGMRSVFLRAMHLSGEAQQSSQALERWYQEKFESPFNTLRNLQHLLSSVAYNTTALPRVVWTDEETYSEMRYRGAPISLSTLNDMISDMENDAAMLFERKVLLGLNLRVTYPSVYDDLTNTYAGYSFLSDARNGPDLHQTLALLEGIHGDPVLRAKFICMEQENALCWDIGALRSWLADYARLQRLQLVIAHCTAGSPSRGTEITCMLRANTALSGGRNLVFVGQKLTLLCTYQKTSAMRGESKLIPHALSGFSSDLLVQDLAIARPFAEFAAHLVFPGDPSIVSLYRNHIFVNQSVLFITPDITSCLEGYTLKWIREKLGVNALRHIFTAFRRKRCSRMEELFEEDTQDSIGAAQMGHSRSTENRIYGLEANGLHGAPDDLLRHFIEASLDWQLVLRIVPGGLSLPYRQAMASQFQSLVDARKIRPRLRGEYPDRTVEAIADILVDRLSKKLEEHGVHGGSAGRMMKQETVLAQDNDGPGDMAATKRTQGRAPDRVDDGRRVSGGRVSQKESDAQVGEDDKKGGALEEEGMNDEDTFDEAGASGLAALRSLLADPEATWVSEEQRLAVVSVLLRRNDVIALLPTGSGKSMLAFIPAVVQRAVVTVLVCPLRSLIVDYQRRIRILNIPHEVYNGNPLEGKHNLVLVSADSVRLDEWREHLLSLNKRMPVFRFVFDEAHIPLVDANYRQALRNMYEMRSFLPAQVVLMSGSVPTRGEEALCNAFGIHHDSQTIRASCNRPEIQYVWQAQTKHRDFVSAAVRLAREFEFISADDRGLIFVPSIEAGRTISSQLSFPFYTSDVSVSPSERDEIYGQWISGRCPFMVCTSAFGAGNDYPHVRFVIHAGTPFDVVSYLQETGRAGRDGKPAVCVLVPGSVRKQESIKDTLDFAGSRAMLGALQAPVGTCIRGSLTQFIDGAPSVCTDDYRNQQCSGCEQQSKLVVGTKRSGALAFETAASYSKRRKVSRELSETDYGQALKDALIFWSKSCIFCAAVKETHAISHNLMHCPTLHGLGGDDPVGEFRKFKSQTRFASHFTMRGVAICFKCWVPAGLPIVVHPLPYGSNNCSYPDIVCPIAYAVWHQEDLRKAASTHFNEAFKTLLGFTQWLGSSPTSPYSSNAVALFLWYHSNFVLCK